ncbi:MAG: NAD-dependent malic enzyme [Acidimicrobiales bacterium]
MTRTTHTGLRGSALIETPILNKGTAFSPDERQQLGLEGLLPSSVESLEEQLIRVASQYRAWTNDLDRHIYLRQLQDANEVLFARFVLDNVDETLPIVYTPTVGDACIRFSEMHRRPRGLFVAYPDRHKLDEMLANISADIDVIVVTDGERILGLGDQGAGGMGIPIGKLSLYTVFGGIDPARVLPVVLDVGTNNAERLDDPLYLGWRNERITGDDYLDLVDAFVDAVEKRFPNVLLQWEDFAQHHATVLLDRHADRIASFNDDIQGTAAVALATIWSAVRAIDQELEDQIFCISGAGSAGTGIASMLRDALTDAGVKNPTEHIYMLDSRGLITDRRPSVKPHQVDFVQPWDHVAEWADGTELDLASVVKHVRPTVLIGVSGQPSTFDEAIVSTMSDQTARPIIMPLSNPTSRSEAIPADILRWSTGSAIVATGSPFSPVRVAGQTFSIAQANNVYVFPGVGLGVVLSGASSVSDRMLLRAAQTVATIGLDQPLTNGILPPLAAVPQLSLDIARSVADCAVSEGLAEPFSDDEWERRVAERHWTPEYDTIAP